MFLNKCVRGNTNLCMGCRTCIIACVEAHSKIPVYEIKPEDIRFNPKLHMIKTYDITIPYQCRHCENPECMKVCAKGALYHADDRILVDAGKCDGCGDCVTACPFDAIDMVRADDSERMIANKCDLCNGVEGGPACVRVCPTGALSLVDSDSLEERNDRKRYLSVRRPML